jgi:hypothetical protein
VQKNAAWSRARPAIAIGANARCKAFWNQNRMPSKEWWRCPACNICRHGGRSGGDSNVGTRTQTRPSGFTKTARRSNRLPSGSTSPKQPFVSTRTRPGAVASLRQVCGCSICALCFSITGAELPGRRPRLREGPILTGPLPRRRTHRTKVLASATELGRNGAVGGDFRAPVLPRRHVGCGGPQRRRAAVAGNDGRRRGAKLPAAGGHQLLSKTLSRRRRQHRLRDASVRNYPSYNTNFSMVLILLAAR